MHTRDVGEGQLFLSLSLPVTVYNPTPLVPESILGTIKQDRGEKLYGLGDGGVH